MRVEPVIAGLLLAALLSAVHAEERVRRICIPNADKSDWICGTEDNPPQAPQTATTERRDPPPAPPPFLANPQGTRNLPLIPIAQPRRPAAETQPLPEPETRVETLPDPAATVEEPVRSETAESTTQPLRAQPESTPEPAPEPPPHRPARTTPTGEPEPATEPAPSIEATPDDASLGEPAVEPGPGAIDGTPSEAPEPTVPATEPADSAHRLAPAPWRVDAILDAGTDQWTLQLAHGPDVEALAELATRLGLAHDELHLLPLERDGGHWWMLTWGLHDSPQAARGASARLSPTEGLRGVWPRRIEPLQNEIRRARRTLP